MPWHDGPLCALPRCLIRSVCFKNYDEFVRLATLSCSLLSRCARPPPIYTGQSIWSLVASFGLDSQAVAMLSQ